MKLLLLSFFLLPFLLSGEVSASYAPGGGGTTITVWGTCFKQQYGSYVTCTAGESAPSCPSGSTELYVGFGPMMLYNSYGAASVDVCSSTGTLYYPSGGQANSISALVNYASSSWYYSYANTCRVCLKE